MALSGDLSETRHCYQPVIWFQHQNWDASLPKLRAEEHLPQATALHELFLSFSKN